MIDARGGTNAGAADALSCTVLVALSASLVLGLEEALPEAEADAAPEAVAPESEAEADAATEAVAPECEEEPDAAPEAVALPLALPRALGESLAARDCDAGALGVALPAPLLLAAPLALLTPLAPALPLSAPLPVPLAHRDTAPVRVAESALCVAEAAAVAETEALPSAVGVPVLPRALTRVTLNWVMDTLSQLQPESGSPSTSIKDPAGSSTGTVPTRPTVAPGVQGVAPTTA